MTKVTVLMPVYNGEAFLREAIESILQQTFRDFEFLIIDDGSGDGSAALIRSYADDRIRLVQHPQNRGLVATLNEGLREAKGELVARMDCDDVSLPDRLARQVAYMDAHPAVGVCGTHFRLVPSGQVIRHPAGHEAIKAGMLLYNRIGHPTAMLRKNVLAQCDLYYSASYPHAEDYELWTRCVARTAFANLEEVLLLYRLHDKQVSRQYTDVQRDTTGRILKGYLRHIGIAPNPDELRVHHALAHQSFAMNRRFVRAAARWIDRIRAGNRQHGFFEESALEALFDPFESFRRQYRGRSFRQRAGEAAGAVRDFLFSPLRHARRLARKSGLHAIKRLLGWKV